MKKLLAILSSVGLTTTASTAVVSCAEETEQKAPSMGEIIKQEISNPDKDGNINCYLLVRYEVPKSETVDQVEHNVKLFNSDFKNPTNITKYSAEISEPFYKDNLGKKGDNTSTRVEVKINWTVKAEEKVRNENLYVAYKYSTSDKYVSIKQISITYKAHHYPNKKDDKKPQ